MTNRPNQLVCVCGFPGVGKSTVSAAITERIDAVRFRTDAVRKDLFENPVYTDDERKQVYDELFDQTRTVLHDGRSVVLDGTFAEREHRTAIQDIARSHGVSFRLILVVCDSAVAEERIASRDDISDADVAVHREFKQEFEPIELEHEQVDNSGTLERTRDQVSSLF